MSHLQHIERALEAFRNARDGFKDALEGLDLIQTLVEDDTTGADSRRRLAEIRATVDNTINAHVDAASALSLVRVALERVKTALKAEENA